MSRMYKAEGVTKYENLLEMLEFQTEQAPVISIVGAGGKTSVVSRLAFEYKQRQKQAVVTTTTHMQYDSKRFHVLEPSMEKLLQAMNKEDVVWAGILAGEKIASFSTVFLKEICAMEIPVIIEADGAKRLPCKAPAYHEPVILEETTDVIAVYGLDAVGTPIAKSCHRPEIVAGILNRDVTDCLTCQDIAALALSERGGRKSVLPGMGYHIILNKADSKERIKTGKEICSVLLKNGFKHIYLTARLGDVYEDTN